jgi:folate-binding protein YgfZ
MDQVSLTDHSADFEWISFLGPQVDQLVPELIGRFSDGVRVINAPDSMGSLVSLVIDQPLFAEICLALTGADIPAIAEETFDVLRVEAGIPGYRGELTEAYTPHEIRLADTISDSKGCYTGQEIIARQLTYDKITKLLVPLEMETFVPHGADVLLGQKKVGELTSSVHSPRRGALGMAVLRNPADQPGTKLTIIHGEQVTQGEVVPIS